MSATTGADPFVTINDPDDPNGTDLPIYEGPLSGAHRLLDPGTYPAWRDTEDDGAEGTEVSVTIPEVGAETIGPRQ